MSSAADNAYEEQNSSHNNPDIPRGLDHDNDYVSRTGQSHIPVQQDDKADLSSGVNPATEDSDETLGMSAIGRNLICLSLTMFFQHVMMRTLLTRATLSVDAHEARGPVVATKNQAMKRVCPRLMGLAALLELDMNVSIDMGLNNDQARNIRIVYIFGH